MRRLAAVVVASALALAACSGSSGQPEPAEIGLGPVEQRPSLAVELFSPGDLPDRYADLDRVLRQFVSVFGVTILATEAVPVDDIVHAGAVVAELLDNDEDGVPDDIRVVDALARSKATLVMARSRAELSDTGFFDAIADIQGIEVDSVETLFVDEIGASTSDLTIDRLDGLIYAHGWSAIYPELLGRDDASALARAMDKARAGRYPRTPSPYPESAWFTDPDTQCAYLCQLTRYFTWAHTTLLGMNSGRCEEIMPVWELCTADQVRESDPSVALIFDDRAVVLPTLSADGFYAPDL